MIGLMMDRQLLVTDILRHAMRATPRQEIVTRLVEGGIHRYTYEEFGDRVAQLAHVLVDMGISVGDRVGVIGWNTHRFLELYYATAGIGAVCHTINPRLGPENAGYVMAHAEDKVVFFDTTFAPLAGGLAPHLPSVERYIALSPEPTGQQINDRMVEVYEHLLADKPTTFDWPALDENTACGLCYTSGTTGKPKGVLYSHRSTVLHALTSALPTGIGVEAYGVELPVVPMFHVNAWGVPYVGLLLGNKLVLPGPGMDGESLHSLMEAEGVTSAHGVPTVWLNLLNYVEENNLTFSTLKSSLVGGAALSERIISGFEQHGVVVYQGWGMTEMSPVGTTNLPDPWTATASEEERLAAQLRQGRAVPLIDLRLASDEGDILPHDGEAEGHLQVRGPWVLSSYYRAEGETLTADGWFDTGDVAMIHPDGRMQITDRAKDVIKSGGEWISTIEIENAALSHPAVVQAAAIGMPHPKWNERPLLIVQLVSPDAAKPKDILSFVRDQLPKISWPDDIQVVDEIPLGATGKVLKTKLREMFKDYVLPTA